MPTTLHNTDRKPWVDLQIHLAGMEPGDPVVVDCERYQGPGRVSDETHWGSQFVFMNAGLRIAVETPNGNVHFYRPESVYRSVVLPDPLPETWEAFEWPPWVPEKAREQVEEFWAESQGRGPRKWIENARLSTNGHAPIGSYVSAVPMPEDKRIEGRWVPAWNNIGRLITDDGHAVPAGTGKLEVLSRMDLHP